MLRRWPATRPGRARPWREAPQGRLGFGRWDSSIASSFRRPIRAVAHPKPLTAWSAGGKSERGAGVRSGVRGPTDPVHVPCVTEPLGRQQTSKRGGAVAGLRHCVEHETDAVRLGRRRGYGKSDQLPGGRRSERRCRSAGILCHRIGSNSPSIGHLVGGRQRARVPKLWPRWPTVVARLQARPVMRDESVTAVTCRADGNNAVRR